MGTEHYQGELEEFKSEVIARPVNRTKTINKTIKELVVFEQTEDE
jgi:hypothetical protein